VREALFNILAPKICGSVFVDLFAGSGAVGIEALSRGARKVLFVERSRACLRTIQENLYSLDIGTDSAEILDTRISDRHAIWIIQKNLTRLGESGADIIFADPPYAFESIDRLPHEIAASRLGAEDSIIVIEHAKKIELPEYAEIYFKYSVKKYGDTNLAFYHIAGTDAEHNTNTRNV
jgi:16S rRNA (guanine(966)-N(2))-methyltransferase RsmD